ncbi:MAG: outer membrane beta-barrel protein [Bacteroidota bacterium]
MNLFAQYNIQGTIQDEQNGVLPFANVILLSEAGSFQKGEISNSDGEFTLEAIDTGNYILTISSMGFKDYEQAITLNNHLNLGVITMVESSEALEEVTVIGKKAPYVRKADRTVVNVASLPTAAGGNALELIEKSPSVGLDRVNGNIVLLGRENVMVFINGERTRLNGSELMQYLESIPAANITSVELINSPPASYDADGTGGVINIVTKNFETDGATGNLNVFGGYGERGKYGGSATFNYKSGNLNVYANGSLSHNYTNQNSDINSAVQFNAGELSSNQESKRPAFLGNYDGRIGLAYDFSDTTSIDVFGSFARRRWELEAETTTNYTGNISTIRNDFLRSSETNTTNQYHLSAHLEQKLKNGHLLSADYDYLSFDINNPSTYRLQNFDLEGELDSELSFSTTRETPLRFNVARLDYKGNTDKDINFELGVKLTHSTIQNKTAYIDDSGMAVSDNLLTDAINVDERIYAGYLSLDGRLGEKSTFIAGLRYEYSSFELLSMRDEVNRKISRVFPSLSFTHNFSEHSNLTLNYRERIARVGFQVYAPAFFFFNPYTVLTGDAQVLPNINRTLEATYNYKSFFMSLSYFDDSNPLAFAIPVLNQEENLLLLISDNIEDRKQLGLNLGFPIRFTNFWSSQYSFGGYWRRDKIDIQDTRVTESNPFFNIDVSQAFQLPKNWSLELSGSWDSKTYQGTIYYPERAALNFGIQKKFKNATLGLSWTDIFNSGSFWNPINNLPDRGIFYDWNYELEGSILRLSYTYNFGGRQVKESRSSGANDVLDRVN